MFEISGVHVYYGLSHIIQGIDVAARPGEVVGIFGRNGVGKTTLLKTIAGWVRPTKGDIRLDGKSLVGHSPDLIAHQGVGFVPEDRRIFSDLTVLENLDIGRQSPRKFPDGQPAPSWTLEKLFAIFPNLAAMPDRRGAHMSGGEQQMLTVARTLMGNPLLVALDEPSEGVAPVIVEEMAETIIKLKKQGLSVLLSEQNIHFAELVSDRAYVLEKGQMQWEGRMADLAKDVSAQRSLLSV